MREIPPEVLSSIFTLVVGHNYFGPLNPNYPQKVGAFFLTRICSRWRAVALNTPEIWARIYIRHCLSCLFPLDDHMTEVEQGRLKLCMGRARSFPLSVEVNLEDMDNTPLIGDLHLTKGNITFLRELMENSNWGSLRVRMENIPPDICEAVLETIHRNLQSLRRLEVQFGTMKGRELSLRLWQGATTFPNLRALRIQHYPAFMNEHPKSFTTIDNSIFPYSQLTHIHLDLPRLEEILEILRLCCRSVRSIQIDWTSACPPEAISPPTISLPFLDTLVFNSSTVHNIQTLINTFIAPSLKSLSLYCLGRVGFNEESLFQALGRFLGRSGVSTNLQKLHFSIHGNGDPSFFGPLMDVLEATTGLEELLLNVSEYGQFTNRFNEYSQVRAVDFLRTLARDDDRFLPKLKHLHIHHIDNSQTSGCFFEQPEREWVNEFVAMIELRSAHELRSVLLEVDTISSHDKSDMGLDLERLRRLSGQRGLAIRVVKSCGGTIHHELLGYGLGAQLSVYHHCVWILTTYEGVINDNDRRFK